MLDNIERWFTEEWEIHKLETDYDTWDNPIEAWVFSDFVMGRFRPLTGDRKLSADKLTEFADAKFYCSIDADIVVGDRLVKDDKVYRVSFVPDLMSMGKFLQIELKYLEG